MDGCSVTLRDNRGQPRLFAKLAITMDGERNIFQKRKRNINKFKLYLSTYPAGGARRNRQPEEINCPRKHKK